jgi:hypothetical protein
VKKSRRATWWQWPTVLSIDAPAVAVLWQLLFARVAEVHLGWAPPAVLGLSVWLAYAADRWIEGFRLDAGNIQTPRHQFYKDYRWAVAAIWVIALAADISIAFTRLDARAITAGFLLIAAVAMYLLSHQLVHRNRAWRAPKELCVAALLSAGAVVFVTETPQPGALMMPLALFALLCFTNCALISVWEREVDRAHGQTSLALGDSDHERLIRQLPLMIAVLAAAAAIPGHGAARDAAIVAAISAMLLALVDRLEQRAGRQTARVLADIALMTPALAFIFRP